MRILQWVMVGVILVALLATGASAGQAQTGERPLVVVVEGRRPLDTAAMTNIGPAGISRLADVFRGLGARVQFVRLDAPLPEEAQVVVIARPLRSLPLLQVVYLWQYLERGGSLLLALDPEEFFLDVRNVRPRFNRGGLAPLVAQDFGITVGDTFLAEPLASAALIEELDSTYALTFAELQGEPITAPLARYNVPVWVWGARSMTVDPLGMGSEAVPLLATGTAYGETDPGVFRTSTAPAVAALQFDAGQDVPAGLLTVGARAIPSCSRTATAWCAMALCRAIRVTWCSSSAPPPGCWGCQRTHGRGCPLAGRGWRWTATPPTGTGAASGLPPMGRMSPLPGTT